MHMFCRCSLFTVSQNSAVFHWFFLKNYHWLWLNDPVFFSHCLFSWWGFPLSLFLFFWLIEFFISTKFSIRFFFSNTLCWTIFSNLELTYLVYLYFGFRSKICFLKVYSYLFSCLCIFITIFWIFLWILILNPYWLSPFFYRLSCALWDFSSSIFYLQNWIELLKSCL